MPVFKGNASESGGISEGEGAPGTGVFGGASAAGGRIMEQVEGASEGIKVISYIFSCVNVILAAHASCGSGVQKTSASSRHCRRAAASTEECLGGPARHQGRLHYITLYDIVYES